MARGRKSKYIKRITGIDEELLLLLGQVGVCSKDLILKELRIKEARVTQLVNSKYILPIMIECKDQVIPSYKLNKIGRGYVQNEMSVVKCRVTRCDEWIFDLKLANQYLQYDDEIRCTWKNKHVLALEICRKMNSSSIKECIDATVTIDGKLIGIEVLGRKCSNKFINYKYFLAKKYLKVDKLLEISII